MSSKNKSLERYIAAASFKAASIESPNAWVGHLPFAAWITQQVKPKIFVELGTHSGNSYFSFCQTVKKHDLATSCYAVDTWAGDEHAGHYSDEVFYRVDHHNREHYAHFSKLMRMTFDDALSYFADASIELLHIDGMHTYESVKHDFDSWLPKLAPGSVVLFHDTQVRERNFGVWKLWLELKEQYPLNIEFLHSHGLGVLQLNNAEDHQKVDCLEWSSKAQQSLVRYFAALGDQHMLIFDHKEIGRFVADRDGQLASLNHAVTDRDVQIVTLNQAVTDRDGQIVTLNQAVTDRDGQIVTLNQAVTDRDGQIVTLNQAVTDRDGQLATLNQVVADRDGELASLNQAVAERDGRIEDLNQKKSNLCERVENLGRIVESAKRWQKRSWAKRAFHRWREPNVSREKISIIQKLKKSSLKRIRKLISLSNLNVRQSRILSALHSLKFGYKQNSLSKTPTRSFGHFAHKPVVSIIIVSYNSRNDLQVLFPSITNQTYQEIELILVENGTQNNHDILKQYFKKFKYIQGHGNVGFAAANNIAYGQSKGELIALINPDTKLSRTSIEELVESLRLDAYAAATIPKIRFFTKFVDITFRSSGEFNLNPKEIEKQLNYQKLFILSGVQHSSILVAGSKDNSISLRLPVDESNIKIKLICNYKQRIIINQGENSWSSEVAQAGNHDVHIHLSLNATKNAKWVINNAGSGLKDDGPYDIGLGEYDNGQFDSKSYVQAMCGCALLLRKSAIIGRNIFIPQFYAYYEDSELSAWLQDKGYKILYTPKSIIYHKHSSSSSEGSTLWHTLVSRGKNLYKLSINPNDLDARSKILNTYSDEIPYEIRSTLKKYDYEFLKQINITRSSKKTVGIYNSYWNTFGGGEKHALSFAEKLQDDCDVYLISECDFNIEKLSKYFNIDLSKCHKIIEPHFNKESTTPYDVLINSTFKSNLDSDSKKSYYIVSFPHKNLPDHLLKKYYFLYNSTYTEKWSKKYWRNPNGCVILPIIGNSVPKIDASKKERIILSVGRFTPFGHCKNHGEILDAFCEAYSNSEDLKKWKLILVGSYDEFNINEYLYYNSLLSNIKNYPIEILPNLQNDALNNLYEKSLIYVHATGLKKHPYDECELHEHFGITCFEAIINGCYPIVYHVGGPADQLKWLGNGSIFIDKADLTNQIKKIVCTFENNYINCSSLFPNSHNANSIIESNSVIFNSIVNEIKGVGASPAKVGQPISTKATRQR
jgi:GT2 family glycosyltransferase/ACT domain-containing protein